MKFTRSTQLAVALVGAIAFAGAAVAQTKPPVSTYYPPVTSQQSQQGTYYPPAQQQGTYYPQQSQQGTYYPSANQQGIYYPPQNQQGQYYPPQQQGVYTPTSTIQGTVTRVDPVYDANIAMQNQQRRCYDQRTGQYTIEPMYPDGQYRNGSYQTEPPQRGSTAGNVVSSLLGGIVGVVIGSKVGGGMGSVIASSVGSTMGSMAGQAIYRNANMPQGRTSVCEPIPVQNDNRQYNAYDVSYRIGTQINVLRTTQHYRVGDPITVNVSASPGY